MQRRSGIGSEPTQTIGNTRKCRTNILGSVLLQVSAVFLFTPVCAISAQSKAPTGPYVPLPDPGYGLYYHDAQGSPVMGTRWGYHDGWEDGRRDRNHGDTFHAQDKDRYTSPPDHGGHVGMTRDQYMKAYRTAYIHGYEHGSRL